MILGEIDEKTKDINLEFMQIDKKEFVEKEININDISSEEELIERINNEEFDENKYFKLILIGNKRFEINTGKILKNITYINILKVKDKTKLEIDLETLSKQNNLKGLFVKELLEKIEENPEEKEKIMKAIEIGLNAF